MQILIYNRLPQELVDCETVKGLQTKLTHFYQGTKQKRQTTNNKRQTTDDRRQTTTTTPNTHTHHTPHWGSCGPKPTSRMPVSRIYSATVGSQPTALSASSQNTRTHTHAPELLSLHRGALAQQDQTRQPPQNTKTKQQQLHNCRTRSLLTT